MKENKRVEKQCLHNGHRARMRKSIVDKGGFTGMADHEVLEYILSMAIPRKDTNPLAHMLINYFGSFSNVLDAEIIDLMKVEGIGERTAIFINSFQHILKRYKEDKSSAIKVLSNSKQVKEFIGDKIRFLPKEECYAIFLNSNYSIINTKQIGLSGSSKVLFEVRTIIELALAAKARGVIIVHNHPSGNALPSNEDIIITKNLHMGLKISDIMLIDHYIFAQNSDYSFKENGLITAFDLEEDNWRERKIISSNIIGGGK